MLRRCCTGRCIWLLVAIGAFASMVYIVSHSHRAQIYAFSFHDLYNKVMSGRPSKLHPKFSKHSFSAAWNRKHNQPASERKKQSLSPSHVNNTHSIHSKQPTAFEKKPSHFQHKKPEKSVQSNKRSQKRTPTASPSTKWANKHHNPQNHKKSSTLKKHSDKKPHLNHPPYHPPRSHSRTKIQQHHIGKTENITVSYSDVAKENPHLLAGGRYKPKSKPRQKVAIIIPVRNQWIELRVLLHYLHPMLKRQNLEYGIFVINQVGPGHFNKGKLLNIGFTEVSKLDQDYQCFVFHDVDVLPENYKCTYTCSNGPRYISTAVSKHRYRHNQYLTVGEVSSFTRKHLLAVNGWSNAFDGWRAEENIARRIRSKHLKFWRSSDAICRFTSLPPLHEKENRQPHPPRSSAHKMETDGLSSLRYKHVKTQLHATYTKITVDTAKN